MTTIREEINALELIDSVNTANAMASTNYMRAFYRAMTVIESLVHIIEGRAKNSLDLPLDGSGEEEPKSMAQQCSDIRAEIGGYK